MPSNLFQTLPGGVKLLHINIGNFKTKIADIKNDDNSEQKVHVICLAMHTKCMMLKKCFCSYIEVSVLKKRISEPYQ